MKIFLNTTVDYEFIQLGDLGYTGALNDRQFAALRAEGLTGTLPDMFGQFTGELTTGGAMRQFQVTIAPGKVSSDLSGFPVLVDLADMPVDFWPEVSSGGANIRAYAVDGTTRIPADVISCQVSSKTGCVAVKTDIPASSGCQFLIRVVPGASRVVANDAYGRNAVWSDYEAVISGGSSLENRTGKSLSRIWGYPQAWDLVSTSPIVTGHEGVVGDGSSYVVINSNSFTKYAADLTTVLATKSGVAQSTGSGTDCGGGFYLDGKIYVTTGAPQKISIFDYDTLDFIQAFDISATGVGAGGLAYNPEDGLIYTVVYVTSSPYPLQMLKYSPVDGSYQGAVTLTTASGTGLSAAQGIIWYQGDFYVCSATFHRMVRVSLDGKVTEGGDFGPRTGGVLEDGFVDGDDICVFVLSGGSNGVVQRWRPRVNNLTGDYLATEAARVVVPVTPTTTWTMRGTGRRSDATTRALVTLSPGGSALGNGVNVAWASTKIQAAYDGANTALQFATDKTPGVNDDFMVHVAYDDTSARHAWYNGGSKTTDPVITARGSDLAYLICGGERETTDTTGWRGRVGLCYVRVGVLSDAWIAAEYSNLTDAAFYSVEEI